MARRRDQRIVTKKHLARTQRERILNRYLMGATLAILLLVVGLVGYGFLEQLVIQPGQSVAVVNGRQIKTGEFQKRVRYQRRQLVNQYLNTLQTMQLFGDDESTRSFFINNLQQIELQLQDPTILGQSILEALVDDDLIRQEAARRGITVNREEVEQAIQQAFGYFADGTPTPEAQPTRLPTSTLSLTQLALVTVTPTATASPTPTEVITPTEALTPSPVPSPIPTEELQPTSTPYSAEAYQADFNEFTRNLNQEIQFDQTDLYALFEGQIYREKLGDSITADLSREQEEVWARHILVESEEAANDVINRLNAGEDWTTLAAEVSTDTATKDRGGDLGWFSKGRMDPAFETAAFDLALGQISAPTQSQFGWHVIQALGHEIRPLSPSQYEQLRQQTFEEWLTAERLSAEIEYKTYWRDRVPDEPGIPPEVSSALFVQPTAAPLVQPTTIPQPTP